MRFIIYILLLVFLSFSACQKKVEGCMHPRAKNFNPEADEDVGCSYYQLKLELQHYASSLPNDTLVTGNWINDVDVQPFLFYRMDILASGLHLVKSSNGEEVQSPETIILTNPGGTAVYAEDNFFITKIGNYSYNIAGWAERGTFDKLRFHIGIPNYIRKTNPSKVTENNHPLSISASSYMFDSTTLSYQSCKMVMLQPNTGQAFLLDFFDYIPIELPCNITVVDGQDVPIRLRLDYLALFNGVSLTNDSQETIKSKVVQNFPSAFSIY